MELSEFTGKPCRTKLAYEFLPKKNLKVNLERAAEEIFPVGSVEIKTKVLLMMKINDCTVSLFPSGKLLVRGEKEEDKARKIAEITVKALKESIK
jgi:ArsR family metal-binding transcriptional regulator